jgi:hypothetical protein
VAIEQGAQCRELRLRRQLFQALAPMMPTPIFATMAMTSIPLQGHQQ